jgi:hypothetical protein
MNTNEAIILSLVVLGTLWFALKQRASATTPAPVVDPLAMMQPTPFDPNPIPSPATHTQTSSDICRDYCAGRIVFFSDPGCNCQVALPDERGLRIQI